MKPAAGMYIFIRLIVLISLASVTGAFGCATYKQGGLYRQDIDTVAISVFNNRTYERGLEFSLTKALAGQIEQRSPYKIVPVDRAQTLIEGEITQVHVRSVSKDVQTDQPREQDLEVTIDFRWKDLRTGQILLERKDYTASTVYYPTLGEGRFVGTQETAERLAIGVAQEMQADW